MLFQIGKVPRVSERDDAIDELVACHRRIAFFTATAARLPSAIDAKPEALIDAANQVLRYYTVALPLHAADEDSSLAPRLLSLDLPRGLRDAIERMTREHSELDAIVARALPLWTEVANGARPSGARSRALEIEARALADFWSHHLALEEETIFPAARRLLSAATLEQMRLEMRARRGPETYSNV